MKRRNFIQAAALTGLGTVGLASCMSNNSTESAAVTATTSGALPTTGITHIVCFWLKEGITAAEEQDFLNFFNILRSIPTVSNLHVTKPAPTNSRPVVDNSFSYCILVNFADMDAINSYEVDPIHTEAATKYSVYWTKVQVRDVIAV